MIHVVEANGSILDINMTTEEFMGLIAAAAPSSWITVTETHLGTITLNAFTVAYIRED